MTAGSRNRRRIALAIVDFPQQDSPAKPNTSRSAIENVTRVETFGAPHHHWVHVTVDAADPNVFTFRQRIVASTIWRAV